MIWLLIPLALFIIFKWVRRRMLSRGYEAAPYRYAPETRRTRGSNTLGF